MNADPHPTKRFSNRVENYLKYRPKYPPELLDGLRSQIKFSENEIVADIGSGTGFLTELFLKNGNVVFGVEPNQEMRAAGERYLSAYSKFESINGTAENTPLDNQSIDLVTVGTAFHWFDKVQARREFVRILKPGGYVLLVWNLRKLFDPVTVEYEQILDTIGVGRERVTEPSRFQEEFNEIGGFFGNIAYSTVKYEYQQIFDFEALKGRFYSSSYSPLPGEPMHDPAIKMLKALFSEFQVQGKLVFRYETYGFTGQLVSY